LGDPEIALQAGIEPIWAPSPGGAGAALAAALIDGTLLPGATIAGGDGIVALDLGGGVQYLGLLRLGGFADSSDGSQRVIAAALDQTLRQATGLVLDLRAATTGAETEALLVATRFVSERTVVATIEARVDTVGGRIYAGDAVVNPMPTGPFAGRVVVLVGAGTAGPGELLALALASLPNVTILGEPTAGSPRSPLVRTLPNGWVLGVPNTEVTVTGVPRVGNPLLPAVTVVLTGGDVAAGRDPGLEAALVLLGS
jgi:C-terminal processing protease CtpA/Prc